MHIFKHTYFIQQNPPTHCCQVAVVLPLPRVEGVARFAPVGFLWIRTSGFLAGAFEVRWGHRELEKMILGIKLWRFQKLLDGKNWSLLPFFFSYSSGHSPFFWLRAQRQVSRSPKCEADRCPPPINPLCKQANEPKTPWKPNEATKKWAKTPKKTLWDRTTHLESQKTLLQKHKKQNTQLGLAFAAFAQPGSCTLRLRDWVFEEKKVRRREIWSFYALLYLVRICFQMCFLGMLWLFPTRRTVGLLDF